MKLLVNLVSLSLFTWAGGAPKPSTPEWDGDLIGSWWGVEAVDPDGQAKLDAIWKIKEGTIVVKDHPLDSAAEWQYTVNLTVVPHQIDIRPTTGPAKGKTLKGVYSINKDRMTICFVSPDTKDPDKQERPIGVDKVGAGTLILRFKR